MKPINKMIRFACSASILLFSASFILGGCAPQAQIDMLDRNVSGLQVETHRIGQEVEALKKQMNQLQGQAEGGGGRSIARLNARIDGLESELMRLNGLVDQLKYNQEREESELAQLKAEIQATVEKVGKTTQQLVQRPGQEASAKVVETEKEVRPQPPKPQEPQDLYKEGLKLFKMKKYQDAKAAFRDFIKEHPNSPMVANAHFWIGECEYKQSRYEEAILEYNKVISKFPKSNKVPDALLKQGFAFARLGDRESARILLKRLIKNYPRTPQAKAAKRQLKLLR